MSSTKQEQEADSGVNREGEDSFILVKDMEDLTQDCIADMPWAQEFQTVVEEHVRKGFYNWCKIVKVVAGTKRDHVKSWEESFLKQIDETLGVMVSDMLRVSDETCDKITTLLERLHILCKELHMPFPHNIGENTKRSFLEEMMDLQRQINEYEKISDERKADLAKLQKKQEKYCKELGSIPIFNLNYPPLPSSEQLESFQKHIEELEALKFEREEKYYQLRHEILEYIDEIDYVPTTTFEKSLVITEQFQPTTENMKKLELFAEQLKSTKKSTVEEIHELRSRIEELWKLLDIDLKERDEFRTQHIKNSILTLEALRSEVKRCEDIKKVNIQAFVQKLRAKLKELWSQCRCTNQQKQSFKYLEDECYTEDLLDLHELEIRKWENYYRQNHEILSALNKQEELWRKVMSLDNSATCTDRLKNRGGQLLQEERERKKLRKLIPKIEERIKDLANTYLNENGVPFLFSSNLLPNDDCGWRIEQFVQELYDKRENRLKEKLSARKQQREKTPVGPSTSKTVTPALSSTVKRKILGTPSTENTKRLRGETPKSATKMGCPLKNIPKITVTKCGQERRSRKSLEKSNRRRSGRLVAAGARNNLPVNDDGRNTTYSVFENELSEAAANSTFVGSMPKTTPQKPPLPQIPQPSTSGLTTPRRTPRTPNGTPRAGNQTKLSTCRSNTKLFF